MDRNTSKVTNWDKFKLLLWKNWILQWRRGNYLCTVLVLLLPMILSLLLAYIRTLLHVITIDVTMFNPVEISNLELFKSSIKDKEDLPEFRLAYSPDNSYLEAIVTEAAKSLDLVGFDAFPNATALEMGMNGTNYLAGVVFPDSMAKITDYPKDFSFALRFPFDLRTDLRLTWLTTQLFSDDSNLPGPRNPANADGGVPVGYLREGFLPLQHALSMAYIKLAGNQETLPHVDMQRYPYPEYILDSLLSILPQLMTQIIMMGFFIPCMQITKSITSEKESQLKEIMRMMGLHNWIHWMAWFVKFFITWSISFAVVVTFLKIKWSNDVAVLTNSSWSALFFFLLIYSITSICFCFMIATFFSKAMTAAIVTAFVWLLTFQFSDYIPAQTPLATKLGCSLVPNIALCLGLRLIPIFEDNGEGLQWSNLFTPVSVHDSLTIGAIMLMMLLSCVIYMSVCLYMEQIWPGDFGVPRKWNFPFSRKFWYGESEYVGIEDLPNDDVRQRNPDAFEAEPVGKHVGLQVKNLKKRFGEKMAVNGLSMNMYKDEITVLLGHNGAGKTTTISMLTGIIPPTAGTAIINGNDIRSNIDGARQSMGICPQHNVLFDEMSVTNHIVFFSRLKGLKGDQLQKEVNKYLKMIELEKKAKVASKLLSGGMKRKLSVCCALCGGTKVVLLDEPTSGLDPAARRLLWDLLQEAKLGRTLLLTTHYMDESEVLGDRIAIMCDGELKCHGTSFFLKKKYSSGYTLTCVKLDDCDVAKVTALLRQYVPNITPERNIGNELSYKLPEKYLANFEKMFRELETQSDELKLNGYGVGIASMEDVFMKVGAENAADGSRKQHDDIMNSGTGVGDENVESMQYRIFSENYRLVKGNSLYLNQWLAMFYKKALCTMRTKSLLLLQNILPILIVIGVFYVIQVKLTKHNLDPITISLTQYPGAVTVLETDSGVGPGSLESKIAIAYKEIASSYGSKYEFLTTGARSFSDFILDVGRSSQVLVNSRYMAAATVSEGKITAWLNNKPLHTAPLTVNLVHNALARVLVGKDARITVANAPLPIDIYERMFKNFASGFLMNNSFVFSMTFVSSFYIMSVINERATRFKLLQFVGGVRVWIFWLTQLIWDLMTYAVTVLLVVLTMAYFKEEGFSTLSELGCYYVIFMIFGFSMLPFIYLFSFLFTKPVTGFISVQGLGVFVGLVLPVLLLIMESFDSTKKIGDFLTLLMKVIPHSSLGTALRYIGLNHLDRFICKLLIEEEPSSKCDDYLGCCSPTAYFAYDKPGILVEILFMIGTGVVCFLIIICCEYSFIGELMFRCKMFINKMFFNMKLPDDGYVDDDVQNEKNRISNMSMDELAKHNLVLDRVTKFYGKVLAVNQLSLCVKGNECFGLLGVNGAGKTTTFKMMTGDERISKGSAFTKGMNLSWKMSSIYKEIGYCPQFNALLEDLTGREILLIFCLLSGVRREGINHVCEEVAQSFGFMKHIDKKAKAYSGGNKRKLSTAVAVIGRPTVIYLDEPTTGLDPAARRQLWNMLCLIRESGIAIVLTSHSMDECEALCTRLAIMVNGEFMCIGSKQHLKNKFSKGFILKLKVGRTAEPITPSASSTLSTISELSGTNQSDQQDSELPVTNQSVQQDSERSGTNQSVRQDSELPVTNQSAQQDISRVKEFVEREFPQSVLQEEYQDMLTYYIPLSTIKWSKIFGLMENNRRKLNVQDYSISQTTLEEIFLEFAKEQRG